MTRHHARDRRSFEQMMRADSLVAATPWAGVMAIASRLGRAELETCLGRPADDPTRAAFEQASLPEAA